MPQVVSVLGSVQQRTVLVDVHNITQVGRDVGGFLIRTHVTILVRHAPQMNVQTVGVVGVQVILPPLPPSYVSEWCL